MSSKRRPPRHADTPLAILCNSRCLHARKRPLLPSSRLSPRELAALRRRQSQLVRKIIKRRTTTSVAHLHPYVLRPSRTNPQIRRLAKSSSSAQKVRQREKLCNTQDKIFNLFLLKMSPVQNKKLVTKSSQDPPVLQVKVNLHLIGSTLFPTSLDNPDSAQPHPSLTTSSA